MGMTERFEFDKVILLACFPNAGQWDRHPVLYKLLNALASL
jgi:hypothetical protein